MSPSRFTAPSFAEQSQINRVITLPSSDDYFKGSHEFLISAFNLINFRYLPLLSINMNPQGKIRKEFPLLSPVSKMAEVYPGYP